MAAVCFSLVKGTTSRGMTLTWETDGGEISHLRPALAELPPRLASQHGLMGGDGVIARRFFESLKGFGAGEEVHLVAATPQGQRDPVIATTFHEFPALRIDHRVGAGQGGAVSIRISQKFLLGFSRGE